MICLDTNYLILGLVSESREAEQLIAWSRAGERFCAPAVVWYEFRCGPIDARQETTMRALLHDIIPFNSFQADEAARLFNATGRRRPLRVDAMIAAAATSRHIPLATNNYQDFLSFTPYGLSLISA